MITNRGIGRGFGKGYKGEEAMWRLLLATPRATRAFEFVGGKKEQKH